MSEFSTHDKVSTSSEAPLSPLLSEDAPNFLKWKPGIGAPVKEKKGPAALRPAKPDKRRSGEGKPRMGEGGEGKRQRQRVRRVDVVVDESRVAELARLGPLADGHTEGGEYERASPPMSEGVRTLIERLVSVDARNPTVTSVFLLWWQERIVYVGRATYGLFCDGTPSHYHGPDSAAGVQAKLFDRVSLIPCKDEMLGAVVRAFVKLLKPKYNRATKRHPLDEQDRAVLTLLGFDRSLLG